MRNQIILLDAATANLNLNLNLFLPSFLSPVRVRPEVPLVPVDQDTLGGLDVVSRDGHRSAHVPKGVLTTKEKKHSGG